MAPGVTPTGNEVTHTPAGTRCAMERMLSVMPIVAVHYHY
jgi:hypothetical protein